MERDTRKDFFISYTSADRSWAEWIAWQLEWERCHEYLPHMLACDALIESQHLVLPEAADLLQRAGWYLGNHAQYPQAELLCQYALAISEKVYGPDHPDTTGPLHNLALLYQEQGRYEEAEPLYKRVLAIDEKTPPSHRPNIATTLETYASLLRTMHRSSEATSLKKRARTIRTKNQSS